MRFRFRLQQDLLNRGQERYKIFCSPCHGLQGDGNGMVSMRGMKHPPSYHDQRLRQVPNGYILRRDHERFRRHAQLFRAGSAR